jgi:hypothetical protein
VEKMENLRRLLNPLVLNLQKMELELTCPVWWVKPSLVSFAFAFRSRTLDIEMTFFMVQDLSAPELSMAATAGTNLARARSRQTGEHRSFYGSTPKLSMAAAAGANLARARSRQTRASILLE